jgi:predicted nucleic acid-binding protein
MRRTVIVTDCSVTGAWFLPDEASELASGLLAAVLAHRVELAVPVLWHYESLNLLRSAVARKRLTAAAAREAAALWREIPVTWYAPRSEEAGALLDGALDRKLSVYDAAYVALAKGLRCPLLTEDVAILEARPPGVVLCRLQDWMPDTRRS